MSEIVGVDLERTREVFESATDFTIGLEEEFAIVDPESLELAHRFEDLYRVAVSGVAGLEPTVRRDGGACRLVVVPVALHVLR